MRKRCFETAFRGYTAQREGWRDNFPPNVWVGATVVNQEEADRDIPKLLAVPARVRFLSMEPLLRAVNIAHWLSEMRDSDGFLMHGGEAINWVIVGGESGPNARPMHPDWAHDLCAQCEAAGVPFLFKQWGEWCPRGPLEWGYTVVDGVPRMRLTDAGHDSSDLCAHGGHPVWMNRAGKKRAGRDLQGRTWDEVPTP